VTFDPRMRTGMCIRLIRTKATPCVEGGSLVDIQYATAENRRGKKEERKKKKGRKKEETTG